MCGRGGVPGRHDGLPVFVGPDRPFFLPQIRASVGRNLEAFHDAGRRFARLRHKDADLIRFDWLPDRGGRQEVRVDRVFPAAKRFAPIDLRGNPTGEALESFVRAMAARLSESRPS